jgi:hypothetical protein
MGKDKKLNDLIESAEKLFECNPAPWSIFEDGFDVFVIDAIGNKVFGGKMNEDKSIVSLVNTINFVLFLMDENRLKKIRDKIKSQGIEFGFFGGKK